MSSRDRKKIYLAKHSLSPSLLNIGIDFHQREEDAFYTHPHYDDDEKSLIIKCSFSPQP